MQMQTTNNGSSKNKQTRNKFDMGSYNCYKSGPITVSRFLSKSYIKQQLLELITVLGRKQLSQYQ